MKIFLIKLFLFILPIAILFCIIEKKIYSIPFTYSVKNNALKQNSKNVNTLILGTSQALYGLDPAYFSKTTINLANSSQSLYFDKEILLKQINSLPKLKNVILTITYFNLYYDMNDSREKIRTYAYYHFLGIKNHNFNYLDINNYSLIAMLGLPRVYKTFQLNFKKMPDDDGDCLTQFGFYPLDSINSKNRINEKLGKIKFTEHSNLIKTKNLTNNLENLNIIFDELSKKNITPIILSTPTYSTYNKNFDQKIEACTDSIITIYCKKFHCKYFNFSKDSSYRVQDFFDNDHLNKYGAAKFSQQVNSILN